jgi:uncharacterized cupin superfamily protein
MSKLTHIRGSDRIASAELGDAVYFPADTGNTWNVIDTVRKTYFLLPLD